MLIAPIAALVVAQATPAPTFDTRAYGRAASAQFFGSMVAFLFIAINGHLLLINALVQSFQAFPVGDEPFAFLRVAQPQRWGTEIFSIGLWIALPLITMLLFVNLVLGVISRVAPQIGVFSVGFPLTVSIGLIGMVATLPLMQTPFHPAVEIRPIVQR